MPKIASINKTVLWSTWKTIRAEIGKGTVRGVLDFVDYDVDPDVWIKRLLEQLPEGPARCSLFPAGRFNLTGNMLALKKLLREMLLRLRAVC